MFANKAEAEKAARMVARVIGKQAEAGGPFDGGPSRHYVRLAGEERRTRWLWSWEGVADFLAAGYRSPGEDRRAGLVAEAGAYVRTARAIVASRNGDRDQAIVALTYAIDKLLEALA